MQNTDARTTVVVISYNYGCFLRDAVMSAVTQTVPPHVLLVDDASTDETEQVARTLVSEHPAIRYRRLDRNIGLANVRNLAAELAVTEWIVYLDADDWLDARFIARGERQVASDRTLDVLTTDMTIVRDGTRPFVSKARAPHTWHDLIHKNTVIQTSFIRRSMILALGGYDASFEYEDWEFWIRALKAGYRIGRLRGPHVYRREHGSNKSKTCNEALATRQVRAAHPLPIPR
jgi:glycosyltransferase involved in cell wall biosynthesis